MGKSINLGKLSYEVIKSWYEQFDKEDKHFICKKCGSRILPAPCFISVHLKIFDPMCAGCGQVIRTIYPFCPKCDGDIEHATACIHVGTDLKTLIGESSIN